MVYEQLREMEITNSEHLIHLEENISNPLMAARYLNVYDPCRHYACMQP